VLSTLHTSTPPRPSRVSSRLPPHQQKQVRLHWARCCGPCLAAPGAARGWQGTRRGGRGAGRQLPHPRDDRGQRIAPRRSPRRSRRASPPTDADLRSVADGLFKQNLIAYEEALRQCSNPDDFALRVSASAAPATPPGTTSRQKTEAQKAQGAQAPGDRLRRPGPLRATGQAGRVRRGEAAAGPAKPASPGSDDDFQIERF